MATSSAGQAATLSRTLPASRRDTYSPWGRRSSLPHPSQASPTVGVYTSGSISSVWRASRA
eukprot:scaffold649302_cov46-Prasinocladus_malaysianus.AAC.1